MAAVTTQSANLVRQRAYSQFYTANPGVFYAMKQLFLHLAANKGNPDLQLIQYAAEDIIANGGYEPITTGAYTLYAWYGKSRSTQTTTAAFHALHDATSNGATTTTLATQLINNTSQTFLHLWPNGFPGATALTVSSATAVGGGTESQAVDACDGFVIVGA